MLQCNRKETENISIDRLTPNLFNWLFSVGFQPLVVKRLRYLRKRNPTRSLKITSYLLEAFVNKLLILLTAWLKSHTWTSSVKRDTKWMSNMASHFDILLELNVTFELFLKHILSGFLHVKCLNSYLWDTIPRCYKGMDRFRSNNLLTIFHDCLNG